MNGLAKAALLESIVEAAMGGHKLGEWEQVENGKQSKCKLCGNTVWIGRGGHAGMQYSVLENSCPGLRVRMLEPEALLKDLDVHRMSAADMPASSITCRRIVVQALGSTSEGLNFL